MTFYREFKVGSRTQILAFCYRGGGQGAPPKTTFARPKGVCPPKIFEKNNRKNNINNSLLFWRRMVCCSPLLKFFLAQSQNLLDLMQFGLLPLNTASHVIPSVLSNWSAPVKTVSVKRARWIAQSIVHGLTLAWITKYRRFFVYKIWKTNI